MLHYIQRNATNCNGTDNCIICNAGNNFLKKSGKAQMSIPKEKVRKLLDEYVEYFKDSKPLCHGRDLKILNEFIVVFGKIKKQLLGEK